MKRNSLSFIIVAMLACSLSARVQASPGDRWPMYQANAEHSGYIPRTILASLTQPRWSVQAQGAGPTGLAISDGFVFTTPNSTFNPESPLVAQSLVTGAIAWSIDFGSIFSVNQPAIDGGRIYLQTSNNSGETYLHCYGVDGSFQWRAPFGSQWEHYLGPIVVNGNLYFNGGTYGGMYSFSTQGGKMQWYTALPQYDSWSPTWANGKLLAYTNRLDIVEPTTGQSLGTIEDPDYYWSGYSPNQAPVVIGHHAYTTNGGRLIAFNLDLQTIAWTRSIEAIGQVATDGQQLFVIAGGAMSVRDPENGNQIWAWVPSASGSVTTNLVITKNYVIAGDSSSTHLVNRATHQTDHTYPATGMLAYAADTLIIATNQGLVEAYELPTDELFAHDFD
jgi:hypothetical protein